MIPNDWYAIIESKQIRHKPVSIKRMDIDLVLWRDTNSKVISMVNRCPPVCDDTNNLFRSNKFN